MTTPVSLAEGSRHEGIRRDLEAIPPGEQRKIRGVLVDRYPLGWHDDEPYRVDTCCGRFSLDEAAETIDLLRSAALAAKQVRP